MRLFEILLLVSSFVLLAWPVAARPRQRAAFAALAVLLLVVHLVLERYRWQMFLAYLVTLTSFTLALLRLRRPQPSAGRRRWGGKALGFLLWGLALLAAALLPVVKLPQPSGPHHVGRVSYTFTDTAREESYTPGPDDKRFLRFQVWYPAQSTPEAPSAPYLDFSTTAELDLAHIMRVPAFFLGYLHLSQTNAVEHAPLAPASPRYPVLIFSHGLGMLPELSTFLLEDLASQGYVVVGINHTYASAANELPSGEIARYSAKVIGWPDGPEERRDTLIGVMAADIRFVLDQLQALDQRDPHGILAGHLDLDRVGMFGHSLGAAAAVQGCWKDQRCQAVLAMDGTLGSDVKDAQLTQPFMAVRQRLVLPKNLPMAESFSQNNISREEVLRQFYLTSGDMLFDKQQNVGYSVIVDGLRHYNFTDFPEISRAFSLISMTGWINPRRANEIITGYARAFFDRHLKQSQAPLLEQAAARYSEVELRIHPWPR